MKLSLCIIVKNEAETLPKCLNSVKEVVDEIILIDTGSTDGTAEIAAEFGAQVHHWEWNDDFAAARNESLKYATGDWILVLDADEMLVPEVREQMQAAMKRDRILLIQLVRHEVGAQQSPYSLVSRLFRNHPNIQFSRPYHALVDDSIAELMQQEPNQWEIATIAPVAILHDGYQPSAIAAKDKFARAQAAMAAYLANHPGDPYTCAKLGALYVQAGEISLGIELLQQGLAAESIEIPVLYELHYHLGIAYNRQEKFSKAKGHYEQAIALPILPSLKLGAYNNLGNLLLTTGDLSGAKSAYEMAIKIDPNLVTAYYNLGITLKAKGKLAEAIAAYRQAIERDPTHAEAHQNLAVALLKAGHVLESLDVFSRAIALYEQRHSPAAAQLRQSLTDMGFKI